MLQSIIHRVRPVAQEEIEMEPEVEPVVVESSLSVEDAPKTERPSFDSFVRAAMMATSGSSDAVLSCDVNGIVNFSRGPQLKKWSEFLSHEELPLYLEVGDRLSEILELGYDLFLLQLCVAFILRFAFLPPSPLLLLSSPFFDSFVHSFNGSFGCCDLNIIRK